MKNRAQRVRYKLRNVANGRIRLSVFKSLKHLYVQAIDDNAGRTIAFANTNLKEFSVQGKRGEQARQVGKDIAEKLLKMNVKDVYFDRGPYAYSGIIKELAESARSGGLNF